MLTILPHGCDHIVDGPCSKEREGISSGVVVEDFFGQVVVVVIACLSKFVNLANIRPMLP